MEIVRSDANGVCTITLNRPSVYNSFNQTMAFQLQATLDACSKDDSVRVIVITGEGKAFSAGQDLGEATDNEGPTLTSIVRDHYNPIILKIREIEKPVIAAVNGFALGGGLELAMASHIRIASTNARMGLPEVSLGVIPGYGGTQRLAQLVGRGKANEMVFTAGMIKADEALSLGLVNHVVEQEELLAKAEEIANKILANSGMAISSAINSINANYKEGVNGFETEISEFGKCFGTSDFKEGTTAFLEKRKPNFRN